MKVSVMTKMNSNRQIKFLCIVPWSFFQRQRTACKMPSFIPCVTLRTSDAIHYQLPGPGRSVRERQVGLYREKIYLAPVSGMEVDKSLHPALNLQGVTFWLTKTSPSVSFWQQLCTNYHTCSFIYSDPGSFRLHLFLHNKDIFNPSV